MPYLFPDGMTPKGDQPQAIAALWEGIQEQMPAQTLLGVTGSGKTFTMANLIAKHGGPALVIAHNKTLAGQLWQEFSALFPSFAVEYFVSYYDYYQPEAYLPGPDRYIEKDSAINDEIDRLRHAATHSLMTRRDVIVIASVSCIYGIGSPQDYQDMMIQLRPGMEMSRETLMEDLVALQFSRNDYETQRGSFRVRGDTVLIYPSFSEKVLTRVRFFGDEIEDITEIDAVTGRAIQGRNYTQIYPASLYAMSQEKIKEAVLNIQMELSEQLAVLHEEGKLIEAYRLEQRTRYDMELLLETGTCKGIENYSRFMDGRRPGEAPYTLMDFFPKDYLLFIDESHVTVPQIGAMYNGDRSRKDPLVTHGFRLPSAYDNRPLRFEEFEERMGRTIFVSATPARYEAAHAKQVVEQIIRPTGLLDPELLVHPVADQIAHLTAALDACIAKGERALVLTLTKRMAEDLSEYFENEGYRVRYLHSDIKTVERLEILTDLRRGVFDILVGINLLREGLDLPEVSLIAILDADKEGFLRSTTSLIQIIGRAARHVHGRVILYADEVTDSMDQAMMETQRRRELQEAYNRKHQITPTSIKKGFRGLMDTAVALAEESALEKEDLALVFEERHEDLRPEAREKLIQGLEREMKAAAKALDFEAAAELRDKLIWLKGQKGKK